MMLKKVLGKNACKYFYNLHGKRIAFKVNNFEDTGCGFTIKNISNENIYTKCGIFILIITINLVNIVLNIVHISFSVILYLLTMYLLYRALNTVKQESLLMIPSLGYQIDKYYMYRHTTKFLPWDKVSDIIINEVITRHKVIFVLTLLTNDDLLIPLFMGNNPRLELLELIYKKIHKLRK